VAALAHGFASFDPSVAISGLICNRVGSPGHLTLLRRALEARPDLGLPVLGGLGKNAAARFPERHLGLVSARQTDLIPAIEAWAAQVESSCDVDALLALARSAPPLAVVEPEGSEPMPKRCRIGVADDAAFHFYYEANLHLLERAGATIVRFSPLTDASPGEVDGVYLGGGYPELYAAELAHNRPMLEALRAHAREGRPIYAECGGLMYLSEAIVTLDGAEHAMLGLVPGRARMMNALQALGYVAVTTRDDSPLGPAGTTFRGHQFRYSTFESPRRPTRYALSIARSGAELAEGYGEGNVLGSYVHAHWASSPQIPERFVESCRATRRA
jgi:cobyrinic acid a,c-diamide synthase